MSAFLGPFRRRLLGIPAREIAFERRGFRGSDPAMRSRLEQVGRAFASGYHAALQDDNVKVLVPALNSVDLDLGQRPASAPPIESPGLRANSEAQLVGQESQPWLDARA